MTTMHSPYPELAEGTYITPNPASSFDNEYNNLTKHDLLEKESVRLTYSARQNPTLKSVHDFIIKFSLHSLHAAFCGFHCWVPILK